MTLYRFFITTAFLFAAGIPAVNASIQISATRVIYPAAEKNVSVHITNPGKYPVLLQSWTDDGNTEMRPDLMRTPFVLTPPLTRVNADAGQTLRLSFVGPALPTDRESLFWLNVLEIPPVGETDKNQIQVAFRSRIKLFYRPASLDSNGAQQAASQLRWQARGNTVALINPTPYYVSAVSLSFTHGGKTTTVAASMVAPKSSTDIPLPAGIESSSVSNVKVESINDYGSAVTTDIERQ